MIMSKSNVTMSLKLFLWFFIHILGKQNTKWPKRITLALANTVYTGRLVFSTNMGFFCKIMPALGYTNVFTLYFLLKVRLEKECSMTTKFMLELEVCLITFTLRKTIHSQRISIKKKIRRPWKIQCTLYSHHIDTIIAPLFVYVWPPPLGSKLPHRTQLSDGVGC